jgi:hypothetical protein
MSGHLRYYIAGSAVGCEEAMLEDHGLVLGRLYSYWYMKKKEKDTHYRDMMTLMRSENEDRSS